CAPDIDSVDQAIAFEPSAADPAPRCNQRDVCALLEDRPLRVLRIEGGILNSRARRAVVSHDQDRRVRPLRLRDLRDQTADLGVYSLEEPVVRERGVRRAGHVLALSVLRSKSKRLEIIDRVPGVLGQQRSGRDLEWQVRRIEAYVGKEWLGRAANPGRSRLPYDAGRKRLSA